MTPFFILASGSPRRCEFMQLLGLPFQVITPAAVGHPIDETSLTNESPPNLVQRLSRLKAEAVATALPALNKNGSSLKLDPLFFTSMSRVVVAADTIVVLDDQILGKPKNPAEAELMLTQLRNRAHSVYSGLTVVALKSNEAAFITQIHHSTVWMRPYTNAEIATYIASGDPLDKAGAYGIQHKGFSPVARLEGCFASVMGLPLGKFAAALGQLGLTLPEIGPLCAEYTGQRCCV